MKAVYCAMLQISHAELNDLIQMFQSGKYETLEKFGDKSQKCLTVENCE